MGRFCAAPSAFDRFLIWNVAAGSVRLSASEIKEIFLGGGDLSQRRILLNIRLPRILAAMLLGGALSVSGYLLQTFFHNPIAGPFVLGISSGAKLTVSIAMIVLLSRGIVSSSGGSFWRRFWARCSRWASCSPSRRRSSG